MPRNGRSEQQRSREGSEDGATGNTRDGQEPCRKPIQLWGSRTAGVKQGLSTGILGSGYLVDGILTARQVRAVISTALSD